VNDQSSHLPPHLPPVSRAFPRARRLTVPAQFAAGLASRQVVRGRRFALHWLPNNLAESRIGLVMGKRFAARAVERNLLKRTWREVFRTSPPLAHPCDIVVRLMAQASRLPDLTVAGPSAAPPGATGRPARKVGGKLPPVKAALQQVRTDSRSEALRLLAQLRRQVQQSSRPADVAGPGVAARIHPEART